MSDKDRGPVNLSDPQTIGEPMGSAEHEQPVADSSAHFKKCPSCAEEIRLDALKCRYCGALAVDTDWHNTYQSYVRADETLRQKIWDGLDPDQQQYLARLLDRLPFPGQGPLETSPDYSSFAEFSFYTSLNSQVRSVFAQSHAAARSQIESHLGHGESITRIWQAPIGRYPCPRCGNSYTRCSKELGCPVLIMIFVSLGLGLIMIPFLPHECTCQACGNRWKT